MEHGECHLTVPSPVALTALARVAGRGVSHTGAVATRPAGAQRVDAHFAQGALFGQVAWRAPVQRRDSSVKQRRETLGKLSDKRNIEFYRAMKPTLTRVKINLSGVTPLISDSKICSLKVAECRLYC